MKAAIVTKDKRVCVEEKQLRPSIMEKHSFRWNIAACSTQTYT
ncbi:hypothetical protein HNR77_001407 [Paenibacillus sp. JGP012]|nr:hypothetical protein [Paenibacillus sp. JGP012]